MIFVVYFNMLPLYIMRQRDFIIEAIDVMLSVHSPTCIVIHSICTNYHVNLTNAIHSLKLVLGDGGRGADG